VTAGALEDDDVALGKFLDASAGLVTAHRPSPVRGLG
jgi:hypothetical protein